MSMRETSWKRIPRSLVGSAAQNGSVPSSLRWWRGAPEGDPGGGGLRQSGSGERKRGGGCGRLSEKSPRFGVWVSYRCML